MAWSADDTRLVSCGAEGAVYEWNVHTGKRESENVLKSCVYTGVAVSSDARTIFAAGTALKEIQDSQASGGGGPVASILRVEAVRRRTAMRSH